MGEIRENKSEVYSADSLFELCQKFEIPNSEETKKQLVERGAEQKDVDYATELMTCILGIDASIDTTKKGVRLEFNVSKKPNVLAGYKPESGEKSEVYAVYVNGSADEVELRCKNGLTRQEVLLKAAIHEVRHRLQYQSGFNFFKPEDALNEQNQTLINHINFVKNLQNQKEKFWRDNGETEEFIAKNTNAFEFDSLLIENLALNEIQKGVTMDDLIKTITLQPTANDNK